MLGKIEDVLMTNQGAADGQRQAAPSLDFDAKLAANAWAKKLSAKRKQEKQVAVVIDVPSGQQVAVHRMPIWFLLHKGLVPDRLTGYAQEHVRLLMSGDPELAQRQTMTSLAQNKNNEQQQWADLLDEIWIQCVVLPKFARASEATVAVDEDGNLKLVQRDAQGNVTLVDGELPDEPVFPVEDVDLIDKIFVYQYCQGVDESVESFLRGTSAALGAMADVTGLSLPPE